MKIPLLLCVVLLFGCHKPSDPYEDILSGSTAELRGWIADPWVRVGDLPVLMDSKGRQYGIENLPKELEGRRVQIKAKAKFSRKMNSPDVTNQLVVVLSDIEAALPEIKRWDDKLAREYKDPSKYVAALEKVRQEIGVPLPFWPAPEAEPNAEVVSFGWSGCGDLYIVFVKTISKSLHNSLNSDGVFELDEREKSFVAGPFQATTPFGVFKVIKYSCQHQLLLCFGQRHRIWTEVPIFFLRFLLTVDFTSFI